MEFYEKEYLVLDFIQHIFVRVGVSQRSSDGILDDIEKFTERFPKKIDDLENF